MKPRTLPARTRFHEVIQRLSECIAGAKDEGVYTEPYAAVRPECAFFSIDRRVLDLYSVCYPSSSTGIEELNLTPRDGLLLEPWTNINYEDVERKQYGDVAWRLDALDRICELFWDQRKTQEALTRNQNKWVEATATALKLTETTPAAVGADCQQLALEKEEAILVQKLDDMGFVEVLLSALCEIVPGYPILLLECDQSARVPFLHRQLRWAKSQLDTRPENTPTAKRLGISMTKLCEKIMKRVSVTKSDLSPQSPTPEAVCVSQDKCDFLVDPDRDLLLDWEDLRRHHQSLHDGGRLKKWLAKPVTSYAVAAWRARAHARCVELHHAISRCKRQLEDNTDARIAAYHQSASPPSGGTANESPDDHATALPTLRQDRAKILLELTTARCLDSLVHALLAWTPRLLRVVGRQQLLFSLPISTAYIPCV